MVRGRKVDYGLDDSMDLFTGLTWPDSFLQDPAYAIFRPLYERTCPWRTSQDLLFLYLNSQARRLGGRKILLGYFLKLSSIAFDYPYFKSFLLSPFEKHNLDALFLDVDKFLQWRFKKFTIDPWLDFKKEIEKKEIANVEVSEKDLALPVSSLSEKDRKKLLKKELSKMPWQKQLQQTLEYESGFTGFHTALIEKALKECPDLLAQKSNEDLVSQIFSTPTNDMELIIGAGGYVVAEIPVMLGAHFLNKKTQKRWFDAKGKKFFRILGCYARWDDAKVVIFKNALPENTEHMFSDIKKELALKSVGHLIRAQVDGIDYYLSLLVDSDLPDRSFLISEWELNCPNLKISCEDTIKHDD
jgi:hypothetical protein